MLLRLRGNHRDLHSGCPALPLLLSLSASFPAMASDDLWDIPLEELGQIRVVSIASGSDTPLDKAAAITSVVTAEDIENMGARDLEEVLQSLPGIYVSKNPITYTPVSSIRGISSFYGQQTLFMINGVPIQSFYVGNPSLVWAGMPLKAVRRIEVIRGPGSALYGADAFSGAVNIITKSAEDQPQNEVGLTAGSFDTYGSWFNVASQTDAVNTFASVEYNQTRGFDEKIRADAQTLLDGLTGAGASLAPGPVNTAYEQLEMRLEIAHERFTWRLGYQGRYDVETGAGVNQALSPDSLFSSDRVNTDFTLHLNDLVQDVAIDIRASYYYNDQQAETDNVLLPAGSNSVYPIGTFPAEPLFPAGAIGNPEYREEQARLDIAGSFTGMENHIWRVGLGGLWNDIYEVTEQKNFGTTVLPDGTVLPLFPRPGGLEDVSDTAETFLPEEQRKSGYLFIQDEWLFAQGWVLTTGLRYDRYSDVGETINPRLALVWATSESITTRFLYGSAFRAPTNADLFVTSNPVALGNPDLDPEEIDTYELAMSHQVQPNFRYGVNTYLFKVRNFIDFVLDPATGLIQAQNANRLNGHGAELEFEYSPLDEVTVSGNYAYQVTENDETDSDVGNAPTHQAYLRSVWSLPSDWFLTTQINWIGDVQRTEGDSRADLDDWYTLDFVIRRNNLLPDLSVALMVKNLSDQNVRVPSPAASFPFSAPNVPGDFPLAGRSVYGEISYTF